MILKKTKMKKMKKAGFLVGMSLLLMQTTQAQTLKDAIKYTENHQFEESSKMLHQLIAKTPTDAHLYYYMGENMWKSERFDSAAFYYDKGIATDPNIGLNYVGKGKIALSKNDEATAKPLFEKALTHHTHDAKAYMAIAEAYIDNEWKDMTYALECLGHAEKLERNNVNIYLLIGDAALLGNNDGLTALNNYEKARDMELKNPKPLIHIGTLYERARSYDLALAEYEKAVSLDTTFAPSYYKLGDLYYQYGDYKKAYQYYDKYVLLSKSLNAKIKRERIHFLTKDYEGAIMGMEDLISSGVSVNVLYRLLAYSYYETKNYAAALTNIEKFLAAAPISGDKIISEDYRYYGKILLAVSKDSTGATLALPQLKTALEMDSTKLDVYGSLADTYLKTKRYDEAIKILQKKISIVKEPSTNDIFKIGQAYYVKAGATKDSVTYLKADSVFAIVTAKQPDLISAHSFRARANAGMDPETKTGLAKTHYETVIALGTLDPVKNKAALVEAHYYMAYLCYNNKDKACALLNIDKVLELDPENKNAPNLKKFIEKLP
jgi:tetratricopeptide (TPR) repeat protein